MPYTKVTEDQFEWQDENTLVHKPTDERFSKAYPDSDTDDYVHRRGNAGTVLPSGEEYDPDEVKQVARKLASERKK